MAATQPWAFLYQNVDFSLWKTKTPFATIRRTVQNEKYFFKIKSGLWALKEFEKDVLKKFKYKIFQKKKTKINLPFTLPRINFRTWKFKRLYDIYSPSKIKINFFLKKDWEMLQKSNTSQSFHIKKSLKELRRLMLFGLIKGKCLIHFLKWNIQLIFKIPF